MMKSLFKNQRGFTLIELLIVIAVLGVLAAVILTAIDPLEQLARGRDSGRKTSISQLGHALDAYATANNATYPVTAGWMTTLQNSGDIKALPDATGGTVVSPACTGGTVTNGICYKLTAPNIVVYSHLESKTEQRKGTCAGVAANTWYVYSSADGKAGTLCGAAEPSAGTVYGAGLLP